MCKINNKVRFDIPVGPCVNDEHRMHPNLNNEPIATRSILLEGLARDSALSRVLSLLVVSTR